MSYPKEELTALRELCAALESRSMTIHENGEDVTQREIDKLKPAIEYLDSVLAVEIEPLAEEPFQRQVSQPRSRRKTKATPKRG